MRLFTSVRKSSSRRNYSRTRNLRFESLEAKQMLTGPDITLFQPIGQTMPTSQVSEGFLFLKAMIGDTQTNLHKYTIEVDVNWWVVTTAGGFNLGTTAVTMAAPSNTNSNSAPVILNAGLSQEPAVPNDADKSDKNNDYSALYAPYLTSASLSPIPCQGTYTATIIAREMDGFDMVSRSEMEVYFQANETLSVTGDSIPISDHGTFCPVARVYDDMPGIGVSTFNYSMPDNQLTDVTFTPAPGFPGVFIVYANVPYDFGGTTCQSPRLAVAVVLELYTRILIPLRFPPAQLPRPLPLAPAKPWISAVAA